MTAWVQSDNWWALIADCGPYTGPWPPLPPPELPLDAGEVDFYVGLPHPSGDPNLFLDWSYNTTYRYGSRSWRGAPAVGQQMNWSMNWGAAGPSPTYTDAPTPGSHLFAFWYDTAFSAPPDMPPPSRAPLQLVPPSYAAGGTGPEFGNNAAGHWSDWVDQPLSTQFATSLYGGVNQRETWTGTHNTPVHDSGQHANPDASVVPQARLAQQDIIDRTAGSVTASNNHSSVPVLRTDWLAHQGKGTWSHVGLPATYSENANATNLETVTGYSAYLADWTDTYGPLHSDPLDRLFAGVDFGVRPDRTGTEADAFLELESTTPTFVGWLDVTVTLHSSYSWGGGVNQPPPTPPAYPSPIGWDVLLRLLDPSVDFSTRTTMYPYAAGAELVTAHVSDSATDAGAFTDQSVLLPLSSIPDPQFALLIQNSVSEIPAATLDLLDFAYKDAAISGFPVDSYQYGWQITTSILSFSVQYQIRPPRFRYWIPARAGAPPPGPTEVPALRLNQRNDGMGAQRHARLNTSGGTPNQPSSFQHTRAPRLFYGGNGYQ